MQTTRSRIQYLSTRILIVVGVLLWVLNFSDMATADMYTDSAHGNTDPDPGYGVNRSGIDHPIGDCAHCHDAVDSPNCGQYRFMLFYDDALGICDLLCFTCHSGSSTWQPVTNYPYCVNFGGAPTFLGTIHQQFCDPNVEYNVCGSRHHLGAIQSFIMSETWGFNSDANPCVACHNPHGDQRSHPVSIDGEGKLNVAIRKPDDYNTTNPQYLLWGDDDNYERMDNYAEAWFGTYQAPFYGDTTSGRYEPDGSTTEPTGGWGSNMPNYNSLCLECHYLQTQSDPERGGATVKMIDWGTGGDVHGSHPGNQCDSGSPYEGTLKAPYTDPDANYILSCLDCHEPHGTYRRLHLIRRVINGEIVPQNNSPCNDPSDMAEICEKCHDWPHKNWGGCDTCHYNATYGGFHGSTINPPSMPCAGDPAF